MVRSCDDVTRPVVWSICSFALFTEDGKRVPHALVEKVESVFEETLKEVGAPKGFLFSHFLFAPLFVRLK